MQKTEEFCVDESGWIHCPFCKCRTRTKIRADTSLKNFPIFCPKCKQECLIDVDNMKIRLSVVPDAFRAYCLLNGGNLHLVVSDA